MDTPPESVAAAEQADDAVDLSVVMPCFNGAPWLPTLLESLARQQTRHSWEFVVADNGSTDSSVEIIRSFGERLPRLMLLDASERRGIGYARNQGVAAAHGHSVLFVDQDDELGDGYLEAMGDALQGSEIIVSRMDFERLNPEWLWRARPNPQASGLAEYDYPPYLPHAGGAGMGIHRQVHFEIGGFGEPLHILEDTDYCWRLQLAGHELTYCPEPIYHYRLRDRARDIYRQASEYGERNVWAYKKYRELGMPKLHPLVGLRRWVSCLIRFPMALTRSGRARWFWSLGWRVGRARGCLRHRVWAL